MTITKKAAREAMGWLRLYPNPVEAQHQVAVQLTAIRPYTSRDLEQIRAILNFCISSKADIQAKRLATLTELAGQQ